MSGPRFRVPAAVAAVLVAAFAMSACVTPDEVAPTAVPTVRQPTAGPAGDATRVELFAALGRASLVVDVARTPFRPAEAEPLTSAPRVVYQVSLPAEANRGFITVYEFVDEGEAIDAAKAQHDYLTSGPGRVQSPLGTDHVLRQVGQTVIYYSWLPAAAIDPSTPRVAEVLRTIGTGFDVQN